MEHKRKYQKSLGPFKSVTLGLGGTIGSGIFIVPAIAARVAGPSSLLSWLVVVVSASRVAFALAKASSKYPSTGAYFIFSMTFGKRMSTFLVVLYLISSVFGIATVAAGVGQDIPLFGSQIPTLATKVAMIVAFSFINDIIKILAS